MNAGKPGHAVGVRERLAGAHPRDVFRCVIVVRVDEAPAELVGKDPADGGLAGARGPDDEDDQ
jgi:hypothetical protein